MYIGQTLPYTRNEVEFTEADFWGASVARHDLLKALMTYGDDVDGVTFFLPGPSENSRDVLSNLRSQYPRLDISICTLSDLSARIQDQPHVFPVPMDQAPALMWTRRLLGGSLYTTMGITHSIPDHSVIGLYMAMGLLGKSYDSLIATSRAGYTALERLFELAAQVSCEHGAGNTLTRPDIVTIPFGVDALQVSEEESIRGRAVLDIEPQSLTVLYIGRFNERFKADLLPLLLSWKRIRDRRPETILTLILAGRSDHSRYDLDLASLAQELGVSESVRFRVNFPYSEKRMLYAASDIVVLPVDNIQETFGLAVLDAMACARPVIASDWSGYRDLVCDGATGFLIPTIWHESTGAAVDPIAPLHAALTKALLAAGTRVDTTLLEDRLLRLVDDAELRHKMGQAAFQRANCTFHWRRIVGQYTAQWREQERRRRNSPTEDRIINAGYSALFGHYASRVEKGETEFSNQHVDRTTLQTLAGVKRNNKQMFCSDKMVAKAFEASSDFTMAERLWLKKAGLYKGPSKS